MSDLTDSERAFRGSLDRCVLKTIFEPDTTAHGVEIQLLAVVEHRVAASSNPYTALFTYKAAADTVRRVIEVWSSADFVPECSLSKFNLGYAAKRATNSGILADGAMKDELVGCLTAPLKAIEGRHFSAKWMKEVLQAASKVYLVLAQSVEEQEQGLAQHAQVRYCTPLKRIGNAYETVEDIKLVHTITPKHPAYDPLFPTFTDDYPGVLGLSDLMVKPVTPQKQSKAKGKAVVDDGQQKITSLFGRKILSPPKLAEHDHIRPDWTHVGKPAPFIGKMGTPTSAVLPTKSTAAPGTPSSSSGPGPGNHAHGPPVPWLEDEEDFIKGLIVTTRGSVSWQELADASNEYFRDKPITKKNGEQIQRGNRGMQGLRQHPHFRGYEKQNWWHRLDQEWKDVGGPSLVIDWAAFAAELRARDHGNMSRSVATASADQEGRQPATEDRAELVEDSEQGGQAVEDMMDVASSLELEAEKMAGDAYAASKKEQAEGGEKADMAKEGDMLHSQVMDDVEMEDAVDETGGQMHA
ncbi:hypothetical protein LTR36_009187 [Oleoguttula mirabilis]|uniref:Myb-like domain-containing protein n=1 Tax=Oleoguttula mirabilis TaxID=1507867 RepID=A0AAV9J6W1_9PEZI|nr:hypothetical protein LTR36_009187 [Oleoguttula mirabilis]